MLRKKKAILLAAIIGIFPLAILSAENKNVVNIKLSENATNARQINEEYKGIWIEYEKMNLEFKNGTGTTISVITNMTYYLKKGTAKIILGSINNKGVKNSDGEYIKVFSDIPVAGQIVGLSSSILTNPLGISLVLKMQYGQMKETNAAAILEVDFTKKSLKLFEFEP